MLWSGGFIDQNHAAPPPQIKLVFAGLWIAGTALILWANAGLKRVRIDERQIHVSNYFQEIDVPLSAITDVSQNRWLNSRPVTIQFGYATELGNAAKFMPKQRFHIRFWRADPVVEELRQLAGIAPKP